MDLVQSLLFSLLQIFIPIDLRRMVSLFIPFKSNNYRIGVVKKHRRAQLFSFKKVGLDDDDFEVNEVVDERALESFRLLSQAVTAG